ncbi:MAG: FHA domain-containing protein [Anaerolineaceae bacterium]|nr:FHA domain-containing protein [Anaerolineaceae bacterium]
MTGKHFIEDSEMVVTQFHRPDFRQKQRITNSLDRPDVPSILEFELDDGMTLSAGTDREILIGRRARPEDPEVSLDLEHVNGRDHGVSRCHAMVAVISDKITIQDLNSLNHTLLNGQRLIPMKRYTLRDGDILTVGKLNMCIHYVL